MTSANNAGSFDITFICKPQRYLESGEEVIELIPGQSETHTYTGNPASFVALDEDQITSLQIPLRLYQNMHGYDHPWPGGGGANMLDPDKSSRASAMAYGLAITYLGDDTFTIKGQSTTTSASAAFNVLTYSDTSLSGLGYVAQAFIVNDKSNNYKSCYGFRTSAENKIAVVLNCSVSQDVDITLKFSVARTSQASWTPYSNICPISGLTGLSVYVGHTQDPDDATVYNVEWTTQAGTVYGGTVDVVTGVLTADMAGVDLGTLTWGKSNSDPAHFYTPSTVSNIPYKFSNSCYMICSDYKYDGVGNATVGGYYGQNGTFRYYYDSTAPTSTAREIYIADEAKASLTASEFKSAMNGVKLVYELATPITYQLTPVQIAALLAGETFVWSSNNEVVTVEVSSIIPTILENPTLFDALPFLRVYGTGILGINSHTITITAADVYTDIDCEMMDCFKGSANKNQYVQFSGNDFPTLEPGVNGFSFSGITKVEVKPRWWSV